MLCSLPFAGIGEVRHQAVIRNGGRENKMIFIFLITFPKREAIIDEQVADTSSAHRRRRVVPPLPGLSICLPLLREILQSRRVLEGTVTSDECARDVEWWMK